MKIDNASKIVATTSTLVAMIVSIAVYFGNREMQNLQKSIQEIDSRTKTIDLAAKAFETAKKQWISSPRIVFSFEAPLARSFALRMLAKTQDKEQQNIQIMIPTSALSTELLDSWKRRKGLMTGKACQREGLKARQVALINMTNFGNVSAEAVKLVAWQLSPINADKNGRWNATTEDGVILTFADLSVANKSWPEVVIDIGSLPESDKKPKSVQVVLASVSGSSDLYGSILVPKKIMWTDPITKKPNSQDLNLGYFRSALLGAEIGSLSAACK